MIRLHEIGAAIRTRRQELGLSSRQLAAFGGMEVQAFVALENGALPDIGYSQLAALLQLVSLSFEIPTVSARLSKRGLWMAAKNISVSYRAEISPETLCSILRSGNCPPEHASNIGCFLDETPLELVIMAVEEASTDAEDRQQIWAQVTRLALQYGSFRNELWGVKPGVEP